jgi:hypothetical protein
MGALILGFASAAAALAPRSVSFQGVALAPDGSPLDGTRNVVIRIYDDPLSASPSDLIYAENHPGTAFVDGVFNVAIGRGTSPSDALSPLDFFDPELQSSRWLEVEIAGEILAPRTQLQSVPYALTCDIASSLEGARLEDLTQGVTAGAGLGGGGTGENVSLFVDFTQTQQRISGSCPAGSSIRQINSDGSVACQGAGPGDITGVLAGSGLSGGGASGDVTLALAANGVSSASIADGSITNADVAAETITAANLAPNSVGTSEITDFSIGSRDVAIGSLNALHLALDSVSSLNLIDEAGADFSDGNQFLSLNSTATNVRSVTIDAPGDGIVIAMASGSFQFALAQIREYARCSLTMGSTIDTTHLFEVQGGLPGDFDKVPFSAIRGFNVSDGPNTFNLVCEEVAGIVDVVDSTIAALFVPTQY